MNIDLNALLVFFEVVNAQSITKAARTLGLPKSTVSRKIRHLEDQVGSKLLKRGNRRIAVTEAGHRLHEHCGRIATEIEVAGLQATQMRTSLKGRLRVSMPIDFGTGWLTRAIASFAECYSEIELDIHVNGRWVDVSEESYDVAIHIGRLLNPDLPFRRLSALTRGVYASPEYAARRGLPHGRWHNHECVLTEQQLAEGVWNVGDNAQDELRRQARILVNNIGVARELVISGIGVGILPNVMCRTDVKSGRLIRIPIDHDIPALEASATFLSGRHMPRKTKVFVDHIADFLTSDEVQVLDRSEARRPGKTAARLTESA
jgi:DNA-binding transcriptional LysR family regulator